MLQKDATRLTPFGLRLADQQERMLGFTAHKHQAFKALTSLTGW
jgi:hypothetical protein